MIQPPDLGVDDRIERVQRLAVELDPAIPHVVRRDRVFDREQRHHLVVTQDHLALGRDDEADVEEPARELRVARLRLRHHEHVPLARQLTDPVRLRTRDVDRAFARVLLMVEVHDLVGEPLQRALRHRHQPDGLIQPSEPERGLEQVLEVFEVLGDLLTAADAPHRGHQADRLVGLDHGRDTTPDAAARST